MPKKNEKNNSQSPLGRLERADDPPSHPHASNRLKEPLAMTREISRCFVLPAAGLLLAFGISATLTYAQSTTPALPNMGQDLTPLQPAGSVFVSLNPGITDHPEWTSTHAVSSVVSPQGDTLLVLTSGFNRVYNNPLTRLPLLASSSPPDSNEHVFIYDLTT